MRSRRSASCSPVVTFCRLSLMAFAIHSGRNQTCLARLRTAWPISFNSCIGWAERPDNVGPGYRPLRLNSGLLDRGRDDEPFAFWRQAAALQDFDTDGAIELAIGQNSMGHDDVGSLMKFIDDNI